MMIKGVVRIKPFAYFSRISCITYMNQLVLCVKLLVAALPVAVGFIYGLLFGLPVLLIQVISAIQETQERVLIRHIRAFV